MKTITDYKCYILVRNFFRGDADRIMYWFTSYNPSFGGTPLTLIREGRSHKLLKLIKQALAENEN